MASPPKPAPDSLAAAIEENRRLNVSLAQLQAEHQAVVERNKKLEMHAASASEQLQQFLYAASHDLQEPLRAVVTYAQLLAGKLENDASASEYNGFVLAGALRMRELLQQLIAYSRAGGAKHRKAIDLNVPLQMALLKLNPEVKATGAEIEREPLPNAIGDENEIAQVFAHLLSNSLKFRSPEIPKIRIAAEQGSDECVISVEDNGVGIDPRFREHVLLPFKRLHSNGAAGGCGLGLAICQKVVSAHGGRIWIESDGEHGTSVRFALPT